MMLSDRSHAGGTAVLGVCVKLAEDVLAMVFRRGLALALRALLVRFMRFSLARNRLEACPPFPVSFASSSASLAPLRFISLASRWRGTGKGKE
jgi:hypothetical protein